jgi:hypothetical protein
MVEPLEGVAVVAHDPLVVRRRQPPVLFVCERSKPSGSRSTMRKPRNASQYMPLKSVLGDHDGHDSGQFVRWVDGRRKVQSNSAMVA